MFWAASLLPRGKPSPKRRSSSGQTLRTAVPLPVPWRPSSTRTQSTWHPGGRPLAHLDGPLSADVLGRVLVAEGQVVVEEEVVQRAELAERGALAGALAPFEHEDAVHLAPRAEGARHGGYEPPLADLGGVLVRR